MQKGIHGSELGAVVKVLYFRAHNRTPVNGFLRSRNWWCEWRKFLIKLPSVVLKCDWECRPAEPAPVPYEIEMDW